MLGKDAKGKTCFDPKDKFAQRTFFRLLAKLQPDIVFAFGDPQSVAPICTDPKSRKHHLVLYINFDGLPVPPDYGPKLNNADMVITKSEFSKEVIRRFLPAVAAEKLGNLYSPADTRRFAPVSDSTKAELRRDLFPSWMPQDAFVLGWIGRNQWRKQVWLLYKTILYLRTGHYLVCHSCGRTSPSDWDPSMAGWKSEKPLASESRPGLQRNLCSHCCSQSVERAQPLLDIFLWLHMTEEPEQDWPLRWLEQQFGVQAGRDIHYTPGHELKGALSPSDLPALYNLWDCLLYLSGGEGFGLPAWEAMCAGVPAIYTNYSAHAEFLGKANAGLPVGGVLQPESKNCIWRMIADLSQVIDAVRRLYFDRALGPALGSNGRAFVQNYTPEIMVEKWHGIFQGLVAGGAL